MKTKSADRILRLIFLLVFAAIAARSAHAEAPAPLMVSVGVVNDVPFAVREDGGEWDGYSVDLLREVALRTGLVLEFREYPSLEALYDAVSRGEVQMGAGNTLVTSQDIQRVDFSQPILNGGLRLMVSKERLSSFSRLWAGLRDNGHLVTLAWGAALTLVASLVLLVLLRLYDKDFPRHWRDGFAEAFYHVVSICVTGKTRYTGGLGAGWIGRILAALWLCFGVGTVAYVTSSVSSVMTTLSLSGAISGPKDLAMKKAAVLSGSAGERYCAVHDIQVLRVASLDEAVSALLARSVVAIVADAASLESYDIRHPNLPITEVGELFERRHFAFPTHRSSPELLQRLNYGIVLLRENGIIDHVRGQWFTQ